MRAKLVPVALLLSVYPMAAEAKCQWTGSGFQPVENDTRTYVGTCDEKGRQATFTPGAGYFFKSVSVASRPRNGKLETFKYGFEYRPKKGYRGPERFAVKVCATRDERQGCSTLVYELTVQ